MPKLQHEEPGRLRREVYSRKLAPCVYTRTRGVRRGNATNAEHSNSTVLRERVKEGERKKEEERGRNRDREKATFLTQAVEWDIPVARFGSVYIKRN